MRRLACLAALWITVSLASGPLSAQTAVLLKDIRPDDPAAGSLYPFRMTTAGGRLFFLGSHTNLWVSDGTALGSQPLATLCAPVCSEILNSFTLISDGRLVYFPTGGDAPPQLWRTDGTRPGTFRLGAPGLRLRTVQEIAPPVAAGGRLFFAGCTAETGCDLWTSDGTNAGTRLVVDRDGNGPTALVAAGRRAFLVLGGELWRSDGTAAGTVALGVSPLDNRLTVVGDRVAFLAQDGAGIEVWISDGTPAGTRALTAFAPLDPLGDRRPQAVGSRLYFEADDGSHGRELWVSDGTPAGTRRLTETVDGRFGTVAEVQGRVVFSWFDEEEHNLWAVPATAAAAAPVRLCRAAACPGGGFTAAGNRLLFAGQDAEHGGEPWSTDGTPQGTLRLGDFCPGPCSGVSSLVPLSGAVYFAARRTDGFDRTELWVSDGTAAGTRRLAGPEPVVEWPLEAAVLGQRLFFTATDPVRGSELWQLDSRRARPRLVADLGRGSRGSEPIHYTAFGSRVLFRACDGTGARLWASTGTEAGTIPLFTAQPPATCEIGRSSAPVVSGPLAYFWDDVATRTRALWRTDGTVEGTLRLAELASGDRPELAAVPGGVVFSPLWEPGELWVSDGTAAGTRRIADLPSSAAWFASLGGEVFFGVHGTDSQVWRTDGTPQGTRVEGTGRFRFESYPFLFAGAVHFFASDGVPDTYRLWRLNRGAGVAPVTGEVPNPWNWQIHRGILYFLSVLRAPDGGDGKWTLWRSDGTAVGTQLIRVLTAGRPAELEVVGDRLVFSVEDAEHGDELWASDGTTAGTGLLRDIVPGAEGSYPHSFEAAGGRLFFSAFDRAHGFELWQTDGTAAGTRLVQDLSPGIFHSDPYYLTPVGDRLYFSADDGRLGFEPWYLPLPSAGGSPCRPSAERLCLAGGRFQVDVSWRDFGGRAGNGRAVPLTNDTGAFWFFDAANLELVVKVLDGNGLNGHFWVFYGALSSVDYTLTVTDTRTGAARRYVNSAGQLASVGDTQAFGPLGASAQTPLSVTEAAAPALAELALVSQRIDPAAAVPCVPGSRRLCLNGGRFAVTATWKDFQNRTGEGTALPLTGDTGAFWFFAPDNLEVLIKVIDGRGLNGKFWVFYGALSNVEYELTVTDTETGTVKTYRNPRGRFASAADTAAF